MTPDPHLDFIDYLRRDLAELDKQLARIGWLANDALYSPYGKRVWRRGLHARRALRQILNETLRLR